MRPCTSFRTIDYWRSRSEDLFVVFTPEDITWTGCTRRWQSELVDELSNIDTMWRNLTIACERAKVSDYHISETIPSIANNRELRTLIKTFRELHDDLRWTSILFEEDHVSEITYVKFQKEVLDWRNNRDRELLVHTYVDDERFVNHLTDLGQLISLTVSRYESASVQHHKRSHEASRRNLQELKEKLMETQRVSVAHSLLDKCKVLHACFPELVDTGSCKGSILKWLDSIESDPEVSRDIDTMSWTSDDYGISSWHSEIQLDEDPAFVSLSVKALKLPEGESSPQWDGDDEGDDGESDERFKVVLPDTLRQIHEGLERIRMQISPERTRARKRGRG